MCVYLIHCDYFASLLPPSCFRWMSLDKRSNVGHFCFCCLRVGDIETPPTFICSESCEYSKDGECDDGGFGYHYDLCASGTDCEVGGFHLRMPFHRNCGFVSELSPSHSKISFFPNTLFSDGRTVVHA